MVSIMQLNISNPQVKYIAHVGGVELESDYPYNAKV
jgi:ribosome-binding factor A